MLTGSTALAVELAALREENARLVMAEAEAMALVLNHEGAIERLTRERDEEREQKHTREGERDYFRAEVARLEGLILAWAECCDPDDYRPAGELGREACRIRAQREEGVEELESQIATFRRENPDSMYLKEEQLPRPIEWQERMHE